jgi:hypothetical protein
LTKTAEAIIAEDDGASLREHIVELIAEKGALQRAVDGGIEDFDLLLEGNKSLIDVHNDLQYRCEDLHVELAEVRSDAKKRIADLEAKVKTAEAHNIDIAAVGKKCLKGFEDEHIRDLAELRSLYVRNTPTIGGLCSPMPEGEPSTADYLRWLSTEISGFPDMFGGVNTNFITSAVEGALIMAGESIDLDALQNVVAASGADLLLVDHDVCKAAYAVSKKWWWCSGYDYVLVAIRAKHEKVLVCL